MYFKKSNAYMPCPELLSTIKKVSYVGDDHGHMDENVLFIVVVGERIWSKLIKGAKTNLHTFLD